MKNDCPTLQALLEAVRNYTDAQTLPSPHITPIQGLYILRSDCRRLPSHRIIRPALCVVVQGAKWTTFGNRRLDYGPGNALLVSIEMPVFSSVSQASPDEPFLAVVIEFDMAVMHNIMAALPTRPDVIEDQAVCAFVTDFDGHLADAVLRMVRLLDTPNAIPVLAPLVMREICYWLLTGRYGGELARMTATTGQSYRLIDAIHALRDRFAEDVRIEDLAVIAKMSPSAFHRQFKAVTSLTPLQYQKHLRLLEARNLMAGGVANAETAAFRVGYESASQFSREYTRMFGAPPKRDIEALRAQP
jgi:AraC-like DNA-binding protein